MDIRERAEEKKSTIAIDIAKIEGELGFNLERAGAEDKLDGTLQQE